MPQVSWKKGVDSISFLDVGWFTRLSMSKRLPSSTHTVVICSRGEWIMYESDDNQTRPRLISSPMHTELIVLRRPNACVTEDGQLGSSGRYLTSSTDTQTSEKEEIHVNIPAQTITMYYKNQHANKAEL